MPTLRPAINVVLRVSSHDLAIASGMRRVRFGVRSVFTDSSTRLPFCKPNRRADKLEVHGPHSGVTLADSTSLAQKLSPRNVELRRSSRLADYQTSCVTALIVVAFGVEMADMEQEFVCRRMAIQASVLWPPATR